MDYTKYNYSLKEYLQVGAVGVIGSFLVLYLFYWNIWICGLLSLLGGVAYLFYEKKEKIAKRQWQLMLEFKDAMESLISALVAGYSMENAITESYKDLILMNGKESLMTKELREMENKMRLQHTLDELLLDFGQRSGLEDVVLFSQIYQTARRSGGNLVKVMKRTAENISEKVEVQREIQTMIAGKKMESNCMMVIPLLIIVYMQVFSPGFLDPLYSQMGGRIFMTGALLVYVFAIIWSRKIMKIEE